ncbi:MAG: hypothetical protein JW844_02745 [Candidatus Omnitrophica bacterium]|nr:hypothetical protein [Candidatus Omnitrophota bacterium]
MKMPAIITTWRVYLCAVILGLTVCLSGAYAQSPRGDGRPRVVVDAGTEEYAVENGDNTDREVPLEARITMDLKDASLKDVLKIFSQQSGLNFIAAETVEDKRITLYLEDVSVQDALDNITQANDLSYTKIEESNIFIVKPVFKPKVDTVTRIYTLKYARVSTSLLEKSASSLASTATGQVGSLTATSGGGGGGGGTSTGIDKVVEKLLSADGKLIVDQRTNSLIITDIEARFQVIEQVICELDVPTPQIIIEAEILETTTNTLEKIGLKWGPDSGQFFSVSAASRSTIYPFGDFFMDQGMTKYGEEAGRKSTAGTISPLGFSMIMEFLENDSETKILARPRLLTLNNESAIIKLTTDAAIGTQATTSTETAAIIATTAERAEVGISLVVTPQINDRGFITMVVEPAISGSVAADIPGFYDKTVRGASTVVRVKDGNTAVFAGLITKEQTTTERRVPVLSKVPVIGRAFRNNSDTVEDKELVIFITPHIVEEPELDYYQPGSFSEYSLENTTQQGTVQSNYYEMPRDLAIEMALIDADK